MKKLLLVLAVVLFANVAKAQDNVEAFGVHVGFKLGYQTAKLSLDQNDIQASYNSNMVLGFSGRLVIHNLIVQPELLYFKSGQVLELKGLSFSDLNPRLEMKQQNLAVPVYLGYQWMIGGPKLLKIRANAGPVIYFVVDQSSDCTITNAQLDVEANNVTWGGALNVGIDLFKFFTLDVNYCFAFSDYMKSEISAATGEKLNWDLRQNMFTVTVGINFLNIGDE